MPTAEDRGFTQQPCGVNEHTCTNLTLGGRQRAYMFSKSFPGEMEAKEQKRTSLDHCSPSFTPQACCPQTSRRLIYTPAVGSGGPDSQIPCVRTPSQPLLRSYLRGRWRSAPWLIIFPCRMRLSVDAGDRAAEGGDRVGSVVGLNARHKGRGGRCIRSYFSWSHYLIIRSLLIGVKPNDEIFNFLLLPPYLCLKWD